MSESTQTERADYLKSFLIPSSLFVFFCQLAVLYPAISIYMSIQDEGSLVNGASRILDGQVPYGDFHTRFMPANIYLLSLGFFFFGEEVWVSRAYFLLSLGLLTTAIWWLSLRLLPNRWAILPVVMFMCVGGHFWPMLSYHWDASIFAILSVLLLTTDERAPGSQRNRLILAGVMAGLTVLFLQPRGVAVCLTIGILALSRGPRPQRLAWVVGGAAIPGALFCAWLVSGGIFHDFWAQAIVYNTEVYSETQNYPFQWNLSLLHAKTVLQGLGSFGQLPFLDWLSWLSNAVSFGLVDFFKYTLFVPIIVILAWQVRKNRCPEKRPLLLGLLILLTISTILTWPRATRYHFNFHTPYFYPVVVYLVFSVAQRRRSLGKGLAAILMTCFLVHGINNYIGWYDYRFPIQFKRGLLFTNNPAQAKSTQELASTLSRSYDQKALFGFPDIAMTLWLSGAKNPTSFDVLAPWFYPDAEFVQARAELERAAPVGILFRPISSDLPGNYPRVNVKEYEAAEASQLKRLTNGAESVGRVGDFFLYQLKK